MAYLGRGLDKISNIEVLDNITFDGSSSYSITKGSVAFTPNSAQSCLISIDGVVQATNFTVNSSTIDFGVAVPSTSTCNFFLHYGTGVMTVPSDGSVTTAKLGSNAVSSAKMFSGFANGITMADQWRLSADVAGASGNTAITTNLERVDDSSFSGIGTGMTESSGIFSFPQTGIYEVEFVASAQLYNNASRYIQIGIQITTDNSSYTTRALTMININDYNNSGYETGIVKAIVDVTDTSNVKLKFIQNWISTTNANLLGATTFNRTFFTFKRLGDT